MARVKPAKGRGRTGPAGSDGALRELAVGRPLQARLISLEKRLGLFSEERSFDADSRFNHPVILADGTPVPKAMAGIFSAELAELKRLGKPVDTCHAAALGPYRVCCRSYFHYDGFKALLYVEQDGEFVAAWKDEEVLYPDSPRDFIAGVDNRRIEAFLEEIGGV